MKFTYDFGLAFQAIYSKDAFRKIQSNHRRPSFFQKLDNEDSDTYSNYYDSDFTRKYNSIIKAVYSVIFKGVFNAAYVITSNLIEFGYNLYFATQKPKDNIPGANTWSESAEFVLKAFSGLIGGLFTAAVVLVKTPVMALSRIAVGNIAKPIYDYVVSKCGKTGGAGDSPTGSDNSESYENAYTIVQDNGVASFDRSNNFDSGTTIIPTQYVKPAAVTDASGVVNVQELLYTPGSGF